MRVPQPGQPTACARCSITNRGGGSGRSCTWRTAGSPAATRGRAAPQPPHRVGQWSSWSSTRSTCRRVRPAWPGWPPGLRPCDRRRLRVRGGAAGPSCEGGWPLLPLCRPQLPLQVGHLLPQRRILGLQGPQPLDQLADQRRDRMAGQHGVGGHEGQTVGEGRGGHGGYPTSVAQPAAGSPNPAGSSGRQADQTGGT